MNYRCSFAILAFGWLALLPASVWAIPPHEGQVQRILFLGNSITLHPPLAERGWQGNWGMAASTLEKDFAHRFAARLSAQTGVVLKLVLTDPARKQADGSPVLDDVNVLNIADLLEREYRTFDVAKLRAQIAAKPDVVVLQFGENMHMDAFDAEAFANSLRALATALHASSQPTILLTSQIYGPNDELDRVKRQVVADDPQHRVFVDLSDFRREAAHTGLLSHPSDRGMQFIADALYAALHAHGASSVPERAK